MALQGDSTKPINLSLNNLATTDFALPPLWDIRYQQLLDNDAGLNKTLTDILTGKVPVRKIQSLATVEAVRAFTGMQDGETSYLKGFGLYRYYAEAVDAERLPWVILPTANAGGSPGRWKLDMVPAAQLAVPNGVATLDGNGFVSQSLPGQSVAPGQVQNSSLTDAQFALVTINAAAVPNSDTGKPGSLLSFLAHVIRSVTGNASWQTDAPVSLLTLNQYGARIDRVQNWTQPQTLTSLSVTANLIIPVV
jgi:hypothetical protein